MNDIRADVDALNAGKISFAEFQRRSYRRTREEFLPKLLEYRAAGKWQEFVDLALSVFEVMPIAFKYYNEIPDNMRYQFAIRAYIHHGDSIPAVRAAVRNARKYGEPKLPTDISATDVITVYRAGEEPIEKCKYRISWTTDINLAKFFYYDYAKRHANHIYKAQIKTADIIAYCNDRDESEIMQYRKVFNIEDITASITR